MSAPLFTSTSSPPSAESSQVLEVGSGHGGDTGHRRRRRMRIPLWWDGVPMRARLIGIVVVLLVVALTATGWGLQHVLRGYLVARVDSQLASATQLVIGQSNYDQGDDQVRLPTDYVMQYAFDNGNPPVRTWSPLHTSELPNLPKLSSTAATARNQKPFTVLSADGATKWRVVAVAGSLRPIGANSQGIPGSVEISLPLTGVSDAVSQVRLLFILFGLMVTGICAILGWLAIRRAFLPLTEVEDTAAAIAAGDLSRRIPDHPASTEVGRLTSSLNGMLSQIESAFHDREASEQRTRRFAADASHELRTPLASIRGFAELYRQGAVSEPEDVTRVMSRIEDESRRMGALVEDLLLLARLDEQRPARTDPVDLAVLAGDATHDARGLAPDRRVQLVGLAPGRGPEPAVVIGDDNRLRQVVANLVGNAARHTPPGTPIEVAVGTWNGRAVLEVRDHGPGLAPEHAVKVFERFYRVDASRARSQGGGSGLGLSIVSAVINAHRGRVGVAPTPGGGATFRIELPVAQVPVADDVADLDLDSPALSAVHEQQEPPALEG
jgi:two-component system OmpR family sensor kinase